MNILFGCSELYPLVKTGGLADVAYNLPRALQQLGHSVRIILPAYRGLIQMVNAARRVGRCTVYGHSVDVLETSLRDSDLVLYLVDCPTLFDRGGGPYGDYSDTAWPDNAQRFGLFCRVAVDMALDRFMLAWQPDIVHCNDWQTGLVPVLLAVHEQRPASVFTVHNLGYQGLFPLAECESLELPSAINGVPIRDFRALEFYGQLSFIKGGVVFADAVNTVSPGYAQEVLTPEFGCGLDGLLRHCGSRFSGILNGIDTTIWDPSFDQAIAVNYEQKSLAGKQLNKRALMREFSLSDNENALLLGVVSRLTDQKGIDLILESLPLLLELPINLVVLGSGDSAIEKTLRACATQHPNRISVRFGYDEALAHRIIAGIDALLIPSRYEPCGLTQLYSQRYGTVPIAHAVGGLRDTIVDTGDGYLSPDKNTGILFHEFSVTAFVEAVTRAVDLHREWSRWRQLQLAGMGGDFSWVASAINYVELYHSAIGTKKNAVPGT